jgi:hypothetical protein
MRTSTQQAWIVIVVACALVGGLASFLLATPDQSGRVRPDQLGFQQLNHTRLMTALGGASAYHRARDRDARVTRTATHVAAMGLRDPTAVSVAGQGRAATARIDAFTRWARGLRASGWSVDPGTAVASSDGRVVDVPATVEVTVAQAMQHVRRQRVPVTLELAAAGAGWRLADLHVDAPTTFLRGYLDPTVTRDHTIDVVAARANAPLARAIAHDAATTLPQLRTRYAGIAGGTGGAIWLLDSRRDAAHVLGRPAPPALPTGPDTIAWVDARGELAIDAPAFVALTPEQRSSVLRHALAHLATLEATTAAPPILVEGLASLEARPSIPDAELRPLAAAFASGSSGIAKLLVAAPGSKLSRPTDAIAAEAVARWIVHRTDSAHLARLVRQIDAGASPERALADVLHTTPRGVELGTAAWVRMQGVAPGTTLRTAPATPTRSRQPTA